jgi:tetratricopeptide (TPR) repeat protein
MEILPSIRKNGGAVGYLSTLFLCFSLTLIGPQRAASQSPDAAVTLSETDSLVLADLENRTGDAVFDHSLQQALVFELGQSPYLNILSDRKVGEALRAMGRPANERITMAVAREICARSGSKALLGGTISTAGGRYLIDLSALDCKTGVGAAMAHGEAGGRDEVLEVLNLASTSLRLKLGESVASVHKYDSSMAAATSLEALNNYAIGEAVKREKSDLPSIPYFKQAIAADPDFPMAYAALAVIYRNLRQPSLALEYATKAHERRDRVGERERLHVSATYFLVTREVDKEIQVYEQWKEDYPRDFVPHNNLGNDYVALGQLEKALAEYQVAVHLVPSAIAYTNVVGVEIGLNRFDDAQATFDEAFASKLDGGYLRQNLYWLAYLRGDAAKMARQVAWATGKPGDEDALLSIQSDTEASAGRLKAARDFTDRAVESAVRADSKETAALWLVNAALREAEIGNANAARQRIAAASALSNGRDVQVMSAFTLARAGDTARAEKFAADLQKNYPTDTLLKLYWLPAIRGAIEMGKGRPQEALQYLKTAEPVELGTGGTFISYLYPAYLRGQAYLQARDPGAAAIEYRKLLEHSGIVSNFVIGAVIHLNLGRAYAMAGDSGNAKQCYERFLGLWKDADSDVPVLRRAKTEYLKLK